MATEILGSWLDNTDRASTLASSYIDGVINHADTAYATAINLLGSLNQFASFTPVPVEVAWEALELPPLAFDIGTIPVKPTLEDIPSPPVSFDYTETPYVSAILTQLQNKVLLLLTGASGIDDVEDEIFARETERDIRTLNDAVDRLALQWSQGGFTLPDGALTASLAWMNIEYQNRRLDKSRKIAEDAYGVAISNMHKGLEFGISLEDALMKMNSESNRNKIEAAKAILEAGIQIFDALIKEKMAKVELFKAEAQAFEAQAKALGAIAEVDVALYKARTDYNSARANIAIKQIELQVEQLKLQAQLAQAIAQGTVQVAGQLAAGAMSAVNAGAHVNYQGSDSNSVSTSHSDSRQESTHVGFYHNYNHSD